MLFKHVKLLFTHPPPAVEEPPPFVGDAADKAEDEVDVGLARPRAEDVEEEVDEEDVLEALAEEEDVLEALLAEEDVLDPPLLAKEDLATPRGDPEFAVAVGPLEEAVEVIVTVVKTGAGHKVLLSPEP